MRSIGKYGHGFTGILNSEVFRRSPNGRVEVFADSISFPQGILPYGDGFVIDSQDREPDFTAPGGFSFAGPGARLSKMSDGWVYFSCGDIYKER